MSLWRWADMLSPVPESARITLGEGNTPLVKSRHIGPDVGLPNLHFKLEQGNPTGSYKDRFAAVAVSRLVATGKTCCITTSSGNAGAALAAYCAAAGIECRVAVFEGAPAGKLTQMLAYGASVARIRGFGTDPATTTTVFRRLKQLGKRPTAALQVSAFAFSPEAMSGIKTIAFELAEQLPQGMDHVFCPAGGGGLCAGTAQGFAQLQQQGTLVDAPRVECVQPAGNDTISSPLRAGELRARRVAGTSRISGLQVPVAVDGHLALTACRESGGTGHVVSDDDVWEAQRRLARQEGIFTEPAGAVALAGLLKAIRDREIQPEATIVCIVSGSGFKDADAINRMNQDVACPLMEPVELADW